MEATSRIIVEGFVNKQIFPRTKVKSGDFAIFTFSPESVIGEIDNRTKNPKYKTDDITFKGRVPELDGGTRYKITADLKQDAKYGWQYDIVSINSVVKLDTEADVRKFLGYVFTENQINALYEAYPNPVEVLERGDVEALCKIKGIKEAKATKLLNKYNASKDSSKAYMTLSEFGLSKATIDRLVEHYGSADILAEKVKNNPYALIGEGVRIGWSKADSMALRKGIPTNSQFRINAYALYYLRNLAEIDGHTWVPLEALGSGIKGLSKDISTEMVKRELRRMVENKTLFYDKETKRIGLMKYRKLEEMICRELLRLQDAECRKMEFVEETIAECEETVGFQYTEEQKDAIRNLVNKNVILMTGNAGCVDKDTEFFDGTKWKKISEYESGDLVLQYNDDGTANMTKPLMYFKKPCDEFYHFETKYGLNQTVSEDHDMLYWTQNGVKKTDTIKKIIDTQTRDGNGFIGRFNTSFRYSGAGIPLTDEQIRVMCAVICDGSFYKNMENSPSAPSFNRCRFHIKKDRKKERLRQLFTDANIQWKESASAAQGYTDLYIQAPIKTKVFDKYWYNCDNHQLQIICDEIMFWDGSENSTKNGVLRKSFSSTVKETAEFIQFAYSACGYRASIYTNDRRGQKYFTCGKTYERKSIEYNVIVTNRKFIGLCSDKRKSHCKTEISKVPSEDGYKYCFMVESTMLVLRRNGCIFISSNCGKSSLMYPVSRIFRKNGLEFEICALSGKASLNLHEITKEDGKTIHRLLGWNPKFGGPTFTKKNPLPTDVVVLDEVSMVGGELFYSLISAIKDGGRLIMLGDPGQLESIGLCNLISDLRNSGKITCVYLSKIFRQAKKSGIITDSLKVNAQTPIIPPKFHGEEIHGELKDLKIIAKSSSEECLETIKKEFKRLHFDENIPIEDILILSAKRSIGDLSGRSINREIQSMIKFEDENPLKITYSDGIKYDVLYHVGDRVIVMKNNYEARTPEGNTIEIFNGNIGTVIAKDNFRRQLVIRLAQGDVVVEGDMLLELQLGYAISCHRAQGSGFPYVIVACDPGAYQLLTKQWLYTALSRAKKYCVLVGTDKSINQCVKTDRVTRKSTWLSELLMFPERICCIRTTDTAQDERIQIDMED